jgi:hypothetical protein
MLEDQRVIMLPTHSPRQLVLRWLPQTAPRPGSLRSVEEARYHRIQASGLVCSRYGSAPVRPVVDVGFTLVRHFGQSEARHVEPGSLIYPGLLGGVEYGPVLIGVKYTRTLGLSTGFKVGP